MSDKTRVKDNKCVPDIRKYLYFVRMFLLNATSFLLKAVTNLSGVGKGKKIGWDLTRKKKAESRDKSCRYCWQFCACLDPAACHVSGASDFWGGGGGSYRFVSWRLCLDIPKGKNVVVTVFIASNWERRWLSVVSKHTSTMADHHLYN